MNWDRVNFRVAYVADDPSQDPTVTAYRYGNTPFYVHRAVTDHRAGTQANGRWHISSYNGFKVVRDHYPTMAAAYAVVESLTDFEHYDQLAAMAFGDLPAGAQDFTYQDLDDFLNGVPSDEDLQDGLGDWSPKLTQLAGFCGGSVATLLHDVAYDSVVPGICTASDCDGTTDVEPDSRHGWCPVCNQNTVQSALVLAGII